MTKIVNIFQPERVLNKGENAFSIELCETFEHPITNPILSGGKCWCGKISILDKRLLGLPLTTPLDEENQL